MGVFLLDVETKSISQPNTGLCFGHPDYVLIIALRPEREYYSR